MPRGHVLARPGAANSEAARPARWRPGAGRLFAEPAHTCRPEEILVTVSPDGHSPPTLPLSLSQGQTANADWVSKTFIFMPGAFSKINPPRENDRR